MSVLTKVFVVLHVVLSLVMASGLIVFVNKTEDFNQQVTKSKDDAARERSGRVAAEQEAIAARGDRDARVLEADARSTAFRTALDAKTSEVAGVQSQLVAAETARAKSEADAASATLASQGALKTVEAQQKVINDTANRLTNVEKQYTESQTRISQLVQELDGAKARIRRQAEEVAALTEQLDASRSGGGARTSAAADQRQGGQVGGDTAMNLRGVIKNRRNINGVEYATITLGSSDNVTKGMRFKVIDRNNFLGYLTIDNVEPGESVGHLEGPSLAAVRAGTEVRTQW